MKTKTKSRIRKLANRKLDPLIAMSHSECVAAFAEWARRHNADPTRYPNVAVDDGIACAGYFMPIVRYIINK